MKKYRISKSAVCVLFAVLFMFVVAISAYAVDIDGDGIDDGDIQTLNIQSRIPNLKLIPKPNLNIQSNRLNIIPKKLQKNIRNLYIQKNLQSRITKKQQNMILIIM